MQMSPIELRETPGEEVTVQELNELLKQIGEPGTPGVYALKCLRPEDYSDVPIDLVDAYKARTRMCVGATDIDLRTALVQHELDPLPGPDFTDVFEIAKVETRPMPRAGWSDLYNAKRALACEMEDLLGTSWNDDGYVIHRV